MAVIDAQVHVWGAETAERPWAPGGAERARRHGAGLPSFSADELLAEMDAAGVDGAVLVPPSFEGEHNDLVLDAAARHPSRFAAMGRVPLDRPDDATRIVRTWREHPGAIGFRCTFSAGFNSMKKVSTSWLEDGTADWFWPVAAEYGTPVMLNCPKQFAAVRRVAASNPDLRIVIDHLGLGSAREEQVPAVIDDLLTLADQPNIAVKASALPCYTSEPYPYGSLQAQVERVVGAFGATRVFWGSDLTRLPCTYETLVRLFKEELPFLSADDRRLVLGDGLVEWLGWDRGQRADATGVQHGHDPA